MSESPELLQAARRALYLALTLHLEKNDAITAVELWRPPEGDAANPLSGLRRYCHDVANRFGLVGREAELHLSILRSMKGQGISRPVSDPNNPISSGSDYPNAMAVPPLRIEPSAHLMQQFLETVERRVAQELPTLYSPLKWREALMPQLKRLKPVNLADIHNWLGGRTTSLQVVWPPRAEGTRLMNAVYVVLAQWLGPVKADAVFTQILAQFESGQDPHLRSFIVLTLLVYRGATP